MKHKIDALISKGIEDKYFPGAVVYVEQGGKELYYKAFGYASVLPQKQNMERDMIFDIASLTKIFTSTIILKLIDEQRLSLESPIAKWFPELGELGTVTIEQLLTHTSGFMAWYPFYTLKKDESFIIDLLGVLKQNGKELGKGLEYSDLNFILLGKLIEKLEGISLDRVIVEKLTAPLNMGTVEYRPSKYEKSRIVSTEWGNQIEKEMVSSRRLEFSGFREEVICGEVNDGNAYYYLNGVSGHAGVFGEARDLAKLARVYFKNKALNNNFLSAATIEKALKNYTPSYAEGRGLGWIVKQEEILSFGHTGFTGTSIRAVPEKELVIILLTNRLHTEKPLNINTIRNELYDIVVKEWE